MAAPELTDALLSSPLALAIAEIPGRRATSSARTIEPAMDAAPCAWRARKEATSCIRATPTCWPPPHRRSSPDGTRPN